MRPTVIHLVRHFHFGGTETMILHLCRALPEYSHVLVTRCCSRIDALARHGIGLVVTAEQDPLRLKASLQAQNFRFALHHWYPEGDAAMNQLSEELYLDGTRSFVIIHSAQETAPATLRVTKFIAVSNFIRLRNPGIADTKIVVIKNAVDSQGTRETTGRAQLNLVKVCRLFPERVPDDLLEPLLDSPIRDWNLHLIAGEGPRADLVRRWMKEPRIAGRLKLTLNAENVRAHLKNKSIYYGVDGEECEEAWGCAVGEALLAGIPVICRAKGAAEEQIIDGMNGFVCRSQDNLRARLVLLMADAPLRERMGNQARILALDSNSLDRLGQQYRSAMTCF